MRELKNSELLEVSGGGLITATFINAAARFASTLLEMGRSLGTAVVRGLNKSYCTVSK